MGEEILQPWKLLLIPLECQNMQKKYNISSIIGNGDVQSYCFFKVMSMPTLSIHMEFVINTLIPNYFPLLLSMIWLSRHNYSHRVNFPLLAHKQRHLKPTPRRPSHNFKLRRLSWCLLFYKSPPQCYGLITIFSDWYLMQLSMHWKGGRGRWNHCLVEESSVTACSMTIESVITPANVG